MLPRKRMYVLGDAGTMTIVDTARQEIAGTIRTGRGSNWGQPHENTCGKLYISNAKTNDMTIIDEATERVIATAKVGRNPHRNAIFRELDLVYTANLDDDTVTAVSIKTDAVVATVAAGPVPFRLIGMEKKTGRADVWVLDRGSDERGKGTITVISGTEHQVTGSIPVMDRPCNWLFKGPTAHVVGTGSREMLIIDGKASAVVGSAVLTEEPDRGSFSNMVFGSSGLFLANANDTVSVFSAD
jgi:YVTN family beta-propeller protein